MTKKLPQVHVSEIALTTVVYSARKREKIAASKRASVNKTKRTRERRQERSRR